MFFLRLHDQALTQLIKEEISYVESRRITIESESEKKIFRSDQPLSS